ncbi:hypothetical protein [Streptomyces olindensis]|uniref:hypothetical protein n=1 Tax=Streptomyces olindensis TaxID=358823 RepID=UPI00340D61CB
MTRISRINKEIRQAPGFLEGRVFGTGDLKPPIGGAPVFRRWALLVAFRSDEEMKEFQQSRTVDEFTDRAREVWRASLVPTRVGRGTWRGWRPEVDPVPHDDTEPVLSLTYSHIRTPYVPAFLWNNKRVVDQQRTTADGLIAQLGIADDLTATSTLSVWRSQADLVDFAYRRSPAHKAVIKPSLTKWQTQNFSARFRMTESSGTWDGRDPAVAARLAAEELARLRTTHP